MAEEKLKEITQAYEELLSFVEKEPGRRRAAAEDLEELRSTIRKASATRACRLRWAKRAAVVLVASLCVGALLLSVTLYSRLGAAARHANSVLQQALRASQLRQPEWIVSSLGGGYDDPSSPGDLTIQFPRFTRESVQLQRQELIAHAVQAAHTKQTKSGLPGTPATPESTLRDLIRSGRNQKPGYGRIQIENAMQLDAVAHLVNSSDPGLKPRIVHIPGRNSVAIDGIAAGYYWLRFATGRDWAPQAHKLKNQLSSTDWIGPMEFIQVVGSDQVEASSYSIVLRSGK